MGKLATLKQGDTLKFGAGERTVTVVCIDFRRKTVKVHAEGPEFITVVSRGQKVDHEVDPAEKTK